MKKLNFILISLLSIVLVSLAVISVNHWKMNRDSQHLVLAEKKKGKSGLTIKTVKHIKNGQQDYYYFSP
ncbi:polysaccharide deacetylase family protein, partial [Streptococcus canis]